jgi:hypothetical protein
MKDNILDKIRDSIEEAIKPILKKGEAMTPADLESLTKAVCVIEKIKQIEQCTHYDDGEGYSYDHGASTRRYYDGAIHHNGYSGHSIQDRMIDCLERMVDDAQTDYERQTVKKWIKWIRRMND